MSAMGGERAFATDAVGDRNAQEAGIPRRLGERVMSYPLLPFTVRKKGANGGRWPTA